MSCPVCTHLTKLAHPGPAVICDSCAQEPRLSPAMDRMLYGRSDRCHLDENLPLPKRKRRHRPHFGAIRMAGV